MILKNLTLALVIILIGLNLSAHTVEDSCQTKSTSNDLILNHPDQQNDDSISVGMLDDVRNLRLKEDLLANMTLADVYEYVAFDDPKSIVFGISGGKSFEDVTFEDICSGTIKFIDITDEDRKILEEKEVKQKEASITK